MAEESVDGLIVKEGTEMGLFPTQDPEYARVYAEEAAMVDAGELLARSLSEAGLTRIELARRLNVSRSEITERLRGERNITIRTLAATFQAMGARLELSAVAIEVQKHRGEMARLARTVARGPERPYSRPAGECKRPPVGIVEYRRARKSAA